ncbi:MAG: hypothetical protein K9N38_10145 [Candidatus Marinimicrobia bacterium]|nr:hypothetical protein [Candidatus Neomarinimicrobiota bacterium]
MRKITIPVILLAGVFLLASCGGLEMSTVAQEAFENRQTPVSITVFPVRIVAGSDAEYSVDLAQSVLDFFRHAEIANGVVSEIPVDFPVQWHRNQAKMLRESAHGFASSVQTMDIQTDYVFLVEVLGNRDKTRVGGIHCYLLTNGGEFVDLRLTNSHWEEYKAINPTHPQDAIEVVKLMLRNAWLK